MKPLVYRHTTLCDTCEITTLYVFGVPVFQHSLFDTEQRKHRPCGFNVYSEAHIDIEDEDYYEDDTEDKRQWQRRTTRRKKA